MRTSCAVKARGPITVRGRREGTHLPAATIPGLGTGPIACREATTGWTSEDEIRGGELIGVRHVDLHLRGGIAVDGNVDRGHASGRRLPDKAGPIALVVGGIDEEGEMLLAVERNIGVDGRQVDLVLSLREVEDLVLHLGAADCGQGFV